MMLKRFVLLLSLLALGACSSIQSGLSVDAGSQFVLGGNPNGGFRVVGTNNGAVAVEVRERLEDGSVRSVGVIEPQAEFAQQFAAGSAAVVVNRSDRPARVDLTITGDTRLSMGYEEVSKSR